MRIPCVRTRNPPSDPSRLEEVTAYQPISGKPHDSGRVTGDTMAGILITTNAGRAGIGMTHAARAVRHAGLNALHHLTVFAGILAFPLVLLSRRIGVSIPMGAVVSRIHDAYERALDGDETDR